MNYGIVNQSQLEDIDNIIRKDLIDKGVACVILFDTAGNSIVKSDNGVCNYDTYAFTALAAGNFAAVDSMANLVGEDGFSQLFHKGKKTSIHFCKVNDDLRLVSIFGPRISLGLLRLNVIEVINKIRDICRPGQKTNDD